jgi:hypothetical protein
MAGHTGSKFSSLVSQPSFLCAFASLREIFFGIGYSALGAVTSWVPRLRGLNGVVDG